MPLRVHRRKSRSSKRTAADDAAGGRRRRTTQRAEQQEPTGADAKEMGSAPRTRFGVLWRWIWRGGWTLIVFALVIPPLQILAIRWWNPPWTTVMVQRSLEDPKLEIRYQWTDLNRFPEELLWFTVLSEDGAYFDHFGIDVREMGKAIAEAAHGEGNGRGASTITMQCARSIFLWQGRSYVRKVLEIYYALWMEGLLSKSRILELYLNVAETGPGIFGMPAAADAYFDRPISAISSDEAAMLVAILPNPRGWDPRQPSELLRARQSRILLRSKQWAQPAGLRELIRSF